MYRKKENVKKNSFYIDGFFAGVDAEQQNTSLDDEALCECINMYQKGGMLSVREGFETTLGALPGTSGATRVKYLPVAGEIMMDNAAVKLTLIKAAYSARVDVKLLCVKASGECNIIAVKSFSTANINAVRCCVFRARPRSGCGIFIMYYCAGEQGILEVNSALSGVAALNNSDLYTPTVTINGKGNKYYTLEAKERKYAAQKAFEPLNLLSGAFKACFKSDGVSDAFRLPYSSLNGAVTAVFTGASGGEYIFSVAAGATASAAVRINSDDVVAHIDRATGKLTFTSNGTAYALPMIDGVQNNLTVKAYRAENSTIYKCRMAEEFEGHTIFYGGDDECRVYFADCARTLYVPAGAGVSVGDRLTGVTAMKKQNNLMMIFKPGEIYYISSVGEPNYDVESVVAGFSAVPNKKRSVSVHQLSGAVGTVYPETVRICSNRVVFLGTDKNVYALTSTAMNIKQIYVISKQIRRLLANADVSNPFAFDYRGHYMLTLGDKIYLFEHINGQFMNVSKNVGERASRDTVAWFVWDNPVPGNGITAVGYADDAAILSTDEVSGDDVIFASKIGGDDDYIHYEHDDESVDENTAIESGFVTKLFDFGCIGRKKIYSLDTLIAGEPNGQNRLSVGFLTENGEREAGVKNAVHNSMNLRCYPGVSGVEIFGVRMKIRGRLAVGKMVVTFTKM